jgi:hypothetical protein
VIGSSSSDDKTISEYETEYPKDTVSRKLTEEYADVFSMDYEELGL